MSWITAVQEFAKDVRAESEKISWPTRRELRDSTVVVIVTILLVSIFIGIVDRALTFLVGLLFR